MTSSKLNIVFVLPDFGGGGAQRVMIHYMNGLNKEKYCIFLVVLRNEGPLRSLLDSDITLFDLKRKRAVLSLFSMAKVFRRIKPDIVISTMAYMNFSVLLLRDFFPEIAFFVREANMTEAVFKGLSKPKVFLFKMMYRFLYPRADLILAPAKIVLDDLLCHVRLSEDKRQVLYNPVYLEQDRCLQVKSDNQIIEFIASGRLHWQKGFDRLIDELGRNPLPVKHWHLNILGQGVERETLLRKIEEHNLSKHIDLLGFQKNPQSYYRAADYFLLPSRTEGLPNVVLESLACGTPVIAMKEAGGIQEIADQCHNKTVTIHDTIKDFVLEMHQVCKGYAGKSTKVSVPEIFKFDNAVHALEAVLDSCALTKAGLARK